MSTQSMLPSPSRDAAGPPPPSGAIARLARFVLAHRRAVLCGWVVLFIAGAFGASHVSKRLSVDFSLPGQPGYETAKQIARLYGNGGDTAPSILVLTTAPGHTVRSEQAEIAAALRRARALVPDARIVDLGSTHDQRFVTADGRTTFALLFTPLERTFGAPKVPVAIERAVARAVPAGTQVGLTGLGQLASGGSSSGPGVFVETLIGGAGALAVLAFVFASLLAFLPLLIAATSILTTLLVVLGVTTFANVSFIVLFLVSLVGLGVAIDYSLLIVTRWREERDHGRDNAEAVVAAMATAGRAVVLSGLTVAIGLVALIVLPVPGLQSVGYGGMLIPLVSTAVALTLLPALLGGIGPRVDWPRVRHESRASRAWTRWSAGIVRNRWAAAAAAVAILAVLIVPVFSLTTGQTSASALARSGAAHAAYQRLVSGGVPSGVLTPVEVLTSSAQAGAVEQRLAGVSGIATAVRSSAPDSNHRGTTVLIGIPATETVNSRSLAPVRAARTALAHVPGVIGVAGEGAIELDYQHAVFGSFPLMFAIIALLTIALLARAFRSIVLAVKAVALNLISMAAAFGIMTWFWQDGHGSSAVFGIPATGAITFWIPLMVFAFLFGLSMDYEVFILTRVREEYDRTGSTDAAIVEGLGRTGRLVTSAALILFLSFASLASAPDTDVKVLATGLGVGILLDATVVRALLLPALLSLLGRWNWWLPRRPAQLLRVPASPLAPRIGARAGERA
ncbi:MAG TPA: MMPL family transporter [Solirubrobacteraceae bacterium]|nr:MMPL family transporter [Solirubrobacteraceae bacterium]